MKLLLFYRMAFAAALVTLIPLTLMASVLSEDKPVRRDLVELIMPMFQDSTAKKRSAKDKDQQEKPPQDVQDERLKEAQRRAIKQVPRSIPKLKPQPVTGGAKIKRPPIKVPKKGVGVNLF